MTATRIGRRELVAGFAMLLDVGNSKRLRFLIISGMTSLLFAGAVMALAPQIPSQTQRPVAASASSSTSAVPGAQGGLNVLVLDPAHGGTDLGARGTGG